MKTNKVVVICFKISIFALAKPSIDFYNVYDATL